MKPCRSNRKAIVLLAAGDLDAAQTEQLHAHAKVCPGCARYLQEMGAVSETLMAAASEPQVEASAAFHSAVLRGLRSRKSIPGSSWFEQFTSTEKWGLAAACLALGLTVLSLVFVRLPQAPLSAIPQRVVATYAEPELAPTLSNYQIVASRSLEKFDELLTRQANRGLPHAPSYTPASAPAGNGWD